MFTSRSIFLFSMFNVMVCLPQPISVNKIPALIERDVFSAFGDLNAVRIKGMPQMTIKYRCFLLFGGYTLCGSRSDEGCCPNDQRYCGSTCCCCGPWVLVL